MEDNSKRETRDRLIMEALIARRLSTEKEMSTISVELEKLRRQEQVLTEEVRLLDEILGAVPATPVVRSRMEPEQVHTILSPPPAPEIQEEAPEQVSAAAETDDKKRRKGLRRGELANLLRQRFGDKEFSLDDVVGLLLEVEPGDRRKAYHAAWRTVGLLEESKAVQVVSETPSGKGVKKTYRMTPA
jgi:hypothetical protein